MNFFRRRVIFSALATTLVAAGAGYAWMTAGVSGPGTAYAQGVPVAPPVDVAEVLVRPVTDWQRYSGRLEAVERVDIRPLVSGTLTTVHFKDGARVRKGEVLFTIDPRPYQAEVHRSQAALDAARARVAYTASELARGQRLLAENAVAKRDVEEKLNAADEAKAHLQAAQAALEAARLNLEYTRITAAVDGRLSQIKVTVGNVVSAGEQSAPLATLVSVSPLYATFDVDEQTFLKTILPVREQRDVPIELGLANEEGYSRQGHLASVDNQLNTTSGTIRVRAVFDNADGSLVPGLYARVRLGSTAQRDAVLVAEKAVSTDQNRRYVLVLDEQNRANYREVTLGAHVGALRVVEQGLQAGERIVVNGLQRVMPGNPVMPTQVSMDEKGSDHPVAPAAAITTPAPAAPAESA